jgi:uncharacterized membrane protein YsdA (DUF1294 family)
MARLDPPLWLSAGFLLLVAGLAVSGKLAYGVLWLYLIASTVAFITYAWDKSAARNGNWRTRESTLHLLALAGGWPGAWAAQRLLRHKSSKQSFLLVFWLTVCLNCALLGWALWSNESHLLNAMKGNL